MGGDRRMSGIGHGLETDRVLIGVPRYVRYRTELARQEEQNSKPRLGFVCLPGAIVDRQNSCFGCTVAECST